MGIKKSLVCLGMLSVLGSTLPVMAAVTFRYNTDQQLYEAAPGEIVEVSVYLDETAIDGDASQLVTENGLESVQATVRRGDELLTDPARIISAAANNLDFDDIDSPEPFSVSPVGVNIVEFVDLFAIAGPIGQDLGNDTRRVLIMTLTLSAGSAIGETTSFEVFDDPLLEDTFTFDTGPLGHGLDVDPGIDPASFTITVIPEPISGMWFLLCGMPMWLGRFNRSQIR